MARTDGKLTTAELFARWASEYSNIRSILNAERLGRIPKAERIGRQLYFKLSDVRAHEKQNNIQPQGNLCMSTKH